MFALAGGGETLLGEIRLNHDGRADLPSLLEGAALRVGTWLVFDVAATFAGRGVTPGRPSSTPCRWTSASPIPALHFTCRCWPALGLLTYRGS